MVFTIRGIAHTTSNVLNILTGLCSTIKIAIESTQSIYTIHILGSTYIIPLVVTPCGSTKVVHTFVLGHPVTYNDLA